MIYSSSVTEETLHCQVSHMYNVYIFTHWTVLFSFLYKTGFPIELKNFSMVYFLLIFICTKMNLFIPSFRRCFQVRIQKSVNLLILVQYLDKTKDLNFQKLSKHLEIWGCFKVQGTWNFKKWESAYVFVKCIVNKESCHLKTGQGQ